MLYRGIGWRYIVATIYSATHRLSSLTVRAQDERMPSVYHRLVVTHTVSQSVYYSVIQARCYRMPSRVACQGCLLQVYMAGTSDRCVKECACISNWDSISRLRLVALDRIGSGRNRIGISLDCLPLVFAFLKTGNCSRLVWTRVWHVCAKDGCCFGLKLRLSTDILRYLSEETISG